MRRARFVDVAWPDDTASYRTRFATELAAWESHPPDEPLRPADLLSPDGATVVVPIAPVPSARARARDQSRPVFGYTVIRLDMPYVSDEFLPALVDKHFRLEAPRRVPGGGRQSPQDPIEGHLPGQRRRRGGPRRAARRRGRLVRLAARSVPARSVRPTGRCATRCHRRRSAAQSVLQHDDGGPGTDAQRQAAAVRQPVCGGSWSRATAPDRSRRPSRPRGRATCRSSFGVLLLMAATRRACSRARRDAPSGSRASRSSLSRPSRTNCARRSRSSGRPPRTWPTAWSSTPRASSSTGHAHPDRVAPAWRHRRARAALRGHRGRPGRRSPHADAGVDARRRRGRRVFGRDRGSGRTVERPLSRRTCRRSWSMRRALRSCLANLIANAVKYGGTTRWVRRHRVEGPGAARPRGAHRRR